MPHLLDNIELYLYGHSKLSDEDNKNVLLGSIKYMILDASRDYSLNTIASYSVVILFFFNIIAAWSWN